MTRGPGALPRARARPLLFARDAALQAAKAMLVAAGLSLCVLAVAQRMTEVERSRTYHKRYGDEWPFDSPYNYHDPRDIARKEADLLAMTDMHKRYNAWVRFSQELLTPNMTKKGVQVEELPRDVARKLYKFLHDGMERGKVHREKASEKNTSIIACGMSDSGELVYPSLLDMPKWFRHEIAEALQPIHEQWCNCKLKYAAFYGVRVYHDGCTLACHLDRVETHVVSSVIHIADDILEP